MTTAVEVIRRFVAGAEVEQDDVIAALADPDTSVDEALGVEPESDYAWDELFQTAPAEDLRTVPAARWLRCPLVRFWVRPEAVGPVPPEACSAFAETLRSAQPRLCDVAAWMMRGDVFDPDEAVEFARGALPLRADREVLSVIPSLLRLGTPDALALANDALVLLRGLDFDQILADVPAADLRAALARPDVLDAFEHEDEGELLREALLRVADDPARQGLRVCLEVLSRMPEAGYVLGHTVVLRLAATHGSRARTAFRKALADRLLPFRPPDVSAGIAMRDVLETRELRVKLVGRVKDRPRHMRTVGTEELRRRLPVPVFLGRHRVGTAVTERYPKWGWHDTEVEFEAVVDPWFVPAAWRGDPIPVERVDQGPGLPWPAPVAIPRLGPDRDGPLLIVVPFDKLFDKRKGLQLGALDTPTNAPRQRRKRRLLVSEAGTGWELTISSRSGRGRSDGAAGLLSRYPSRHEAWLFTGWR